VECLIGGTRSPGQVHAYVGPTNIGKSLYQAVITQLVGGRSAKAYDWDARKDSVQSGVVGAEHLVLEDEVPTWDATTRRVFGNHIKKVAANRLHKCEGKYLNGVDLTVFWRCTISLNEDCILTLPPVDESIEDKLCIFSCTGFEFPFPMRTEEDRLEAMATLTREVPHYAHWLLHDFALPYGLEDRRFGVKAFRHLD